MENNQRISNIIDFLWEYSHCKYLTSAIKNYNALNPITKYYEDRQPLAKRLASQVCLDLFSGKSSNPHSIKTSAHLDLSEKYALFVLMIPFEDDTSIINWDIGDLFHILNSVNRRLIHEVIKAGKIDNEHTNEVFQRLTQAARTITNYKEKTLLTVSSYPVPRSLKFFKKIYGNSIFDHLSLAVITFFNWRIKTAYIENSKKKPVDPDESPIGKIMVDPVAHLEDLFEFMDSDGISPMEVTPSLLIEYSTTVCVEQNFVITTRHRRLSELQRFFMATQELKTLWRWEGHYQINRDMVAATVQEEDDQSLTERTLILADAGNDLEDDVTVDLPIPMKVDRTPGTTEEEISNSQKTDEYLASYRREKVKAHMRSGGQLLLRYSWLDKRGFTLERICAFTGYISKGKSLSELIRSENDEEHLDGLMILTVLESAFTGTAVKKILEEKAEAEMPNGSFINPIGLYLDINSLISSLNVRPKTSHEPESLMERIKGKVKEFNKNYPELNITLGMLTYGGRAWMIDKMEKKTGMNRLLVSHICGVWLPGVRASGQYVLPDQLVDQWMESSETLIEQLIKISENQTSFPILDKIHEDKEIPTTLVHQSKNGLKEWQASLKKQCQFRQEIFDSAKEKGLLVQLPTTDQILSMASQILIEIDDSKNETQKMEWISVIIALILSGPLLLRPGELEKLKIKSLSFNTSSIFITGKKNRIYSEFRVIPMPDILRSFIYKYVSLQHKLQDTTLDSKLLDMEKTKILLQKVFQEKGLGYFELYSLRKWGATYLHNSETNFDHWQALMGHSQTGFESLGCYSGIRYSQLRSHMDRSIKIFNSSIKSASEKMNRGLRDG